MADLTTRVKHLSFAKKIVLLELVFFERYPRIDEDLKSWFPQFGGEVPYQAFLSDDELNELLNQISKEG